MTSVDTIEATLVEYIKRASAELETAPFLLGYNELQKWMKNNGDKWLVRNASNLRKLGGYTSIRDATFAPNFADRNQLPMRLVEVKDASFVAKKNAKLAAREQIFLDKFEALATNLFKDKLVVKPVVSKKPKKSGLTRELNILLSDLHLGSDLDPRYGLQKYGTVEEARRLAHVVKTVCNYKRDHRDETRLRVHLAGDIIQGQLHDMRDGDILSAQVARAIYLLTQAIGIFASEFSEVVVDCCTGNHDRFPHRHPDRATYEKADSLSTIIYFAVKTATSGLKNVKFDITRKPYVAYDSFGSKCFGTHGDTVLNPGYPGSVINAKNLEGQINRINASLPNSDEYKLFFVGHVHVGTVIHMGNGAILITNGALVPSDQYSVSIGLFENSCGQSMWESVPGHVVGDYRFITVNGGTDKDKELDKVLRPFTDF